jgi:glutamate formiminotransferase/formiminotetrahydrofolate cyclodeaminase
MAQPLLECVPNFSEGRRQDVIDKIAAALGSVDGARVLDVDPGKATNRTVMTVVGKPEAVVEAAFLAIAEAAQCIDMRNHHGEHARMGATDVCPLIPIAGMTMEEAVHWSRVLAERVGRELGVPVYLYEYSAQADYRRNLADIRAGEYEGLEIKINDPRWEPDFGPKTFQAVCGATVIGARDLLVAYNVNLNTVSPRLANSVAFDVREAGRLVRDGHPLTGKIRLDNHGEPVRQPGTCKSVKGVGWYIPEYRLAQVSMNLTRLTDTDLHEAYEAVWESSNRRGLRVTGSELVGLVPLDSMLKAGRYFMRQAGRSSGASHAELIECAIQSMGLRHLGDFDPRRKIIEYALETPHGPLVSMPLGDFADLTASDSPAPGGGSVAAYMGALAAALGAMVANLSAHKRGWEGQTSMFSDRAEVLQDIKINLLRAVDEDTRAFEGVMTAMALPKSTEAEKAIRKEAIRLANFRALQVPLHTMELVASLFTRLEQLVHDGNPNSRSDALVGLHAAWAALEGAYWNVIINAGPSHERTQEIHDAVALGESLRHASKQILERAMKDGADLLGS